MRGCVRPLRRGLPEGSRSETDGALHRARHGLCRDLQARGGLHGTRQPIRRGALRPLRRCLRRLRRRVREARHAALPRLCGGVPPLRRGVPPHGEVGRLQAGDRRRAACALRARNPCSSSSRRAPGRAPHPRAPGTLGATAGPTRPARTRPGLAARRDYPAHVSPYPRHRVERREAKPCLRRTHDGQLRRTPGRKRAKLHANDPHGPKERSAQARRLTRKAPTIGSRPLRRLGHAKAARLILLSFAVAVQGKRGRDRDPVHAGARRNRRRAVVVAAALDGAQRGLNRFRGRRAPDAWYGRAPSGSGCRSASRPCPRGRGFPSR